MCGTTGSLWSHIKSFHQENGPSPLPLTEGLCFWSARVRLLSSVVVLLILKQAPLQKRRRLLSSASLCWNNAAMSAALHFWRNLQAIWQFQVLPSASTREETCLHYLAQFLGILMWQWLMPVFFLYAYLRHVEAASLFETAGKFRKVLFHSRNLMQIDGYFLETKETASQSSSSSAPIGLDLSSLKPAPN